MGRHYGLSLIEVETSFGTEGQCLAYIAAARWPEGVRCLKCGSDNVAQFTTNETTRERYSKKLGKVVDVPVPARHFYHCNAEYQTENGERVRCGHQFSAIAGTI